MLTALLIIGVKIFAMGAIIDGVAHANRKKEAKEIEEEERRTGKTSKKRTLEHEFHYMTPNKEK